MRASICCTIRAGSVAVIGWCSDEEFSECQKSINQSKGNIVEPTGPERFELLPNLKLSHTCLQSWHRHLTSAFETIKPLALSTGCFVSLARSIATQQLVVIKDYSTDKMDGFSKQQVGKHLSEAMALCCMHVGLGLTHRKSCHISE